MSILESIDLYYKIKAQRMSIIAPVDHHGCYCMGHGCSDEIRRFQILIGLLLSSQTKDEVTHAAVEKLNKTLGVLAPETVLSHGKATIHRCIDKVGYHNKKTVFLFEIANMVKLRMPETVEDVLRLPGIGRKMAYLYLYHGFGKIEGVSVDTHVHRISNRIGLVSTKTPEQTRKHLEKMFNKSEWPQINTVMVGFGQKVCLPVKPRCEECWVKEGCKYSSW